MHRGFHNIALIIFIVYCTSYQITCSLSISLLSILSVAHSFAKPKVSGHVCRTHIVPLMLREFVAQAVIYIGTVRVHAT